MGNGGRRPPLVLRPTKVFGSQALFSHRRQDRGATTRFPTWLSEYAANVYTKTGEDGVVQKILETVGRRDGWCVEFGAWDGEHLSNTCNLVQNHGYCSVLIEADPRKYAVLQRKYAGNSKVIMFNQFVGFTDDNLDTILSRITIPLDFDFLSIDIDGNDYHVWKAVSKYQPKVVCIEFNFTIPTEVRFVQPADPRVNQGASLLSLVELGKAKGYELVCVLSMNALFVRSEYFPLFQIDDNRPEVLRTDLSWITYLFSGYDGTTFLAGNRTLPWQGIRMRESRMQHLPRILRGFPDNYCPWQRWMIRLYSVLVDPWSAFRRLRERARRKARDKGQD